MKALLARIKRYITRELLLYVLFGVLTTLVSIAVFQLCNITLLLHYAVANIISWIVAVTFAYVTNRLFVFQSRAHTAKAILREIFLFYGARLLSLAIEEGGLYLLIDVLGVLPLAAKLVMSFVVIAANYIFSKFVVFQREPPNN